MVKVKGGKQMKTKNINKILIISLTILLLVASVISLSACSKNKFEPKVLTVQQAQEAVSTAIVNAKAASSIYMVENANAFAYIDTDDYYLKNINDASEDRTQETWHKYEDEQWIRYDYYSYENGSQSNTGFKFEETEDLSTSNIESFVNHYMSEMFQDILTFEVNATQTEENKVVINATEEDEDYSLTYEINITNEYITSFTMNYFESGELIFNSNYTFSYNVAQVTVPELPTDVEWH